MEGDGHPSKRGPPGVQSVARLVLKVLGGRKGTIQPNRNRRGEVRQKGDHHLFVTIQEGELAPRSQWEKKIRVREGTGGGKRGQGEKSQQVSSTPGSMRTDVRFWHASMAAGSIGSAEWKKRGDDQPLGLGGMPCFSPRIMRAPLERAGRARQKRSRSREEG